MRNWRFSDEAYLMFNWKSKTAKECQDFVIGKSEGAIHAFTRKKGWIKIPNWTQFEINILILHGAKKASHLLGRSLNSCKIKQSRLKNAPLRNNL